MKVAQVDASVEKTSALLHWLQLETLPDDVPADTSKGWWWVAKKDGAPVGFAGLWQSAQWHDAGYLCRAGVVPSARGNGLQKRFIQVRVRKAKQLGWRWVITDTTDNAASGNSLIACGFKLYKPQKPWGFSNACYWRKALNQ